MLDSPPPSLHVGRNVRAGAAPRRERPGYPSGSRRPASPPGAPASRRLGARPPARRFAAAQRARVCPAGSAGAPRNEIPADPPAPSGV